MDIITHMKKDNLGRLFALEDLAASMRRTLTRFTIELDEETNEALKAVAKKEGRVKKLQAELMIKDAIAQFNDVSDT